MKMKSFAKMTALLTLAWQLAACGGGGGGGAAPPPPPDPNAPTSVTLSVAYRGGYQVAMADNAETVTITADVKKSDGGAVPDGTQVSFTPSAGTLSAATAATAGGKASVTLKLGPIAAPAKNQTVTITATAGTVTSASASAKFINKPSSATVDVALNTALTDLAGLAFRVIPSGAAFSAAALINEASTTDGAIFAVPGSDVYTYLKTGAPGIATVANKAIFRFTFTIDPNAIAVLPTFAIGEPTTGFQPLNSSLQPISVTLTTASFITTAVFDTEQ